MGRKFTAEEASPFYPPRARWYAVLFSIGNLLRRRLALDRLRLPAQVTVGGLIAGFLVPGLAVWLRGPRFWGRLALAAGAALLLAYVVWLGHTTANLAFGMLISLHCTGFVYYCNPLLADEKLHGRLTFTFFVLLSVSLLLYWPARRLAQQHLVTPLLVNGQVIVVKRFLPAPAIQRGDWVSYSLAEASEGEAHNGGAVWFDGGAGFGPVLAVAGDQILFSPAGFAVNGVWHTSFPHMPTSGTWTVPEKHWFIWPNLAISGYATEYRISDTLLHLADVAPGQYLGQPFQRWFWRKQILP